MAEEETKPEPARPAADPVRRRVLAHDPRAPLWAMAFSRFLILLAAVYIVGAFTALEPWRGTPQQPRN